jgi:hypothetical protein
MDLITKIKKLAQSPVFSSETDIENFVRIMGLSTIELDILRNSREIIKKYYLTRETKSEDEHIINKAFSLIYDQQNDNKENYNINKKEVTKDIIISPTINNNKIDKIESNPKIIKALQNPYQSLEKFIQDNFLYVSPVYSIVVHFANNHLNDDDSVEEFRQKIENLSDKHILEEIILTGEKQVLDVFIKSTQSTREEIEKIIGRDIGNIFLYNEDILTYLKQEMIKYRNYMIPKMNELHAYAEQLKNFWIQNEEGIGKHMQDFIKGGMWGAAGAALFGPLGILAAMGAIYFSTNENEKKKEEIFNNLFNNWAAAHDSLYFTQIKDYYRAYINLFSKIAKQYVNNYQLAYKFAESHGKKHEYEEYLKKDIINTISDNYFIRMQEELSTLSEFINGKGE